MQRLREINCSPLPGRPTNNYSRKLRFIVRQISQFPGLFSVADDTPSWDSVSCSQWCVFSHIIPPSILAIFAMYSGPLLDYTCDSGGARGSSPAALLLPASGLLTCGTRGGSVSTGKAHLRVARLAFWPVTGCMEPGAALV